MKKFFIIPFVFLSLYSLSAQVYYEILENSYQKIDISFSFGDLIAIDTQTDIGVFSRIYITGCGGSKDIGKPELPISVNILEIPFYEEYMLKVYGKDSMIYSAKDLGVKYPIYSAQPSRSKSHEGVADFFYNENCYNTNNFFALPLASFEKIGMMRNINLGELHLCPIQYNPVKQEIKIFKTIDVEIIFNKIDSVKTLEFENLHQNPMFCPLSTVNHIEKSRTEFSSTPIKYLIVAHSMFRDELDQFISWKKRKGFLVEIGYTDDENVGTSTTSIAEFIKSHYTNASHENPAPTFVLLVGDVQQIPAFKGTIGNHPTDLYYFTWEDGFLPCCYYGRFSAQNVEQLIPQIEKTLQYEQYSMPDPSYLDKISLIAGYDVAAASTYGNGFVNYATQYYATSEYGYSTIYSHLHPCNTQTEAEQIRAEIGAGVGIANFTAHCSPAGWSSPNFYTSHIPAMNNENKVGLMIGNCCESNKFDVDQCFGEALLRASGKGAVGYIGGSGDTYWDEDYYWAIGFRNLCTANPEYIPARLGAYDRLFHTHGESNENWMTTFGSMIVAGNEAVQSSTSELKKYYWEIYHLMGDPSIMTYLTKPARMDVVLNNVIPFGESTFTAKVAPYSYCALTDSYGELVNAGFANADGNITLTFEPMEEYNVYEFAAWSQKYIQYFKTIFSGYEGVEDKQRIELFQLYPNPTTGELRIDASAGSASNGQLTIDNVEVFDIYGKCHLSLVTRHESHITLNIFHLSSGLYFVKISTEAGIVVKKVVKQ